MCGDELRLTEGVLPWCLHRSQGVPHFLRSPSPGFCSPVAKAKRALLTRALFRPCCLCSHAEENAITQAAYHGVSVRGGTIYTTLCPCLMCSKMIINAGIGEVVHDAAYAMDDVAAELFRQSGVKIRGLR